MVKTCKKCKSEWTDEFMSILELHEPNEGYSSDKIEICEDCRAKIWNEYFA